MPFRAFSFRTSFGAICLLILTACSGTPVATTGYTYDLPPTAGGRLCTNQCREASDYCHQDCNLDQRRCIGGVQARAMQDYDKYTRDQFAAHEAIELRPRDFERTEPCDEANKSCLDGCEGRYQVCYLGCGGTVNTTTSCQAFCF
jgi:hypothetical protein